MMTQSKTSSRLSNPPSDRSGDRSHSLFLLSGLAAALFLIGCGVDAQSKNLKKAVFAGGCFWCMEAPFEKLPGVKAVISGFTGGQKKNPTYDEVSSGTTGHAEAVEIHFDPAVISYEKLLDHLWHQIDPTDAGGQFVDRGSQYRSGIFYFDEAQKQAAVKSRDALMRSGKFKKKIVTEITAASVFYPAEEYHQDFYKKSPARYHEYRSGSGRDEFLEKVWGKK